MYAYPDHNFLIYCAQNNAWRQCVLNAHRSGTVRLVFSPWHFYEYGNARDNAETESLIQFAEELQPDWTMEKLDLQLFEFWIVWRQLWESFAGTVEPIGTLAVIMSLLRGVRREPISTVTIRDFIRAFSTDRALNEIASVMSHQRGVSENNQQSYKRGEYTDSDRLNVHLRHVATTGARLELKHARHGISGRADALLQEPPIGTQLRLFVEWGFVKDLKCYQVELALTDDFNDRDAKLDSNRFVDRQHATIALPYCDYFVTSDRDLIKRCTRIKERLPFATAEVMCGEDFIDMMDSSSFAYCSSVRRT